jgi:hypothetical protein
MESANIKEGHSMRDTWYGDRPDLVKWGTLIHLAQKEHIKRIVQVAFFRKEKRPPLQAGSQNNVEIPEEVWNHFRNIRLIENLRESTSLAIEVIDQQWDSKPRQEYVQSVIELLQAKSEKKVVLLDPDTGIEPKVAKREHVKETEVRRFWKSLGQCDWLVLYQHRNRKPDWQELAKSKFQRACDSGDIKTFKADELTKDVVFFAAKKR